MILKKIIGIVLIGVIFCNITVKAVEKPKELYAQSAVLMDADSGRILFEKNGNEKRAMASTTKIMTCILALELGDLESEVEVSENASKQPKVHLGVEKGETFRLRDLLYSLMLESHNDSAVIIAEKISGNVKNFAKLMNKKAKEIGCTNTYFITPNGLDAKDDKGKHSTTAADLAKIMSYCITKSPKKEEFLEITGKKSYQFTNVNKTKTYICHNHNAFLEMMEGALSGKTGFTGEAGYCYVGALRKNDRIFVVSLLGCGWPNNKTYKWADTKQLMKYGIDTFKYKEIEPEVHFETMRVKNSIPGQRVRVIVKGKRKNSERILMSEEEEILVKTRLKKEWVAPIKKGEKAGKISYYLNDDQICEYELITANKVEKLTWEWCIEQMIKKYLEF
ncbi:D-alanyl-D-alanine carboxypeptidase family protein [Faecalimonas sp.]